jgi:uncharacterized membrane protein
MGFLDKKEEERLVSAIGTAESLTSGEIRIHIERDCKVDSYERALEVFGTLKMHETELRNGVLFYLAHEDHKFAVVGDEGIHAKVGDGFWKAIKEQMQADFKAGNFVKGLETAVVAAGEALKHHFPHQGESDVDELSNEISTS